MTIGITVEPEPIGNTVEPKAVFQSPQGRYLKQYRKHPLTTPVYSTRTHKRDTLPTRARICHKNTLPGKNIGHSRA